MRINYAFFSDIFAYYDNNCLLSSMIIHALNVIQLMSKC